LIFVTFNFSIMTHPAAATVDNGGASSSVANDSFVHGNNCHNDHGNDSNYPQEGAREVGIGSGTGNRGSGKNRNGNLQQLRMPGATSAARVMGAASLTPPLPVMHVGVHAGVSDSQNLLYPNSLLNNSNKNCDVATIDANFFLSKIMTPNPKHDMWSTSPSSRIAQ
jgi:hypothetical protein